MPSKLDYRPILDSFVKAIAAGVREELRREDAGTAVAARLLTVDQAARYLGRTKASVQHLVAQRRLPVVREGGRVFLDVRELDRWIEANTEPAKQ
jgi:excisionase family DNA binding protein